MESDRFNHITEIITEDRPAWFDNAMLDGNLFSVTLDKIAELEAEINHLKERLKPCLINSTT